MVCHSILTWPVNLVTPALNGYIVIIDGRIIDHILLLDPQYREIHDGCFFATRPKGTPRRQTMPTSEEQQILRLLAKEWDHSGPPGIMEVSDIVAALNQAPSATIQALKSLYQIGMVDMNVLKTSAFLTPEGHAVAYDDAEQ